MTKNACLIWAVAFISAFAVLWRSSQIAEAAGLDGVLRLSKGWFRPGEDATWTLRLGALATADSQPLRATVLYRITRLEQLVEEITMPIEVPVQGGSWTVGWRTPAQPAAFGLDWEVVGEDGGRLASGSSAFDTAVRWTDIPRYGFLSDFAPNTERLSRRVEELARYHLTGLQFYDWMYRHDSYLPPTPIFVDPLGRTLSLKVVKARIEQARAMGMAPMAYTAVYAASPEFFRQHSEWALYRASSQPWQLGENFLYIMNPARGTPWHDHILAEFRSVMGLGFDGIHVDQYGDPKTAYTRVDAAMDSWADLAPVVRDFLDDAKDAVRPLDDGTILFNAVNDWPTPQVAEAAVDAMYVEIWPPNDSYTDVIDIIHRSSTLSGGKAVVLAAYLPAENPASVRLFNAVAFSHGAYHLELGEGDGMLADPYFPKYQRMSPDFQEVTARYYDFIVRYRDLLYGDVTAKRPPQDWPVHGRVEVSGATATSSGSFEDGIFYFGRQVGGDVDRKVLHFINFTGNPSLHWRADKRQPKRLVDLTITVRSEVEVRRVFWATPDESGKPQSLPFEAKQAGSETVITFRLPSLEYWSMVWFE